MAFDRKHKISDRWEKEPYIVWEKPNRDIPVYKVKREDAVGKIRTLHRNLLLPIGIIEPNINKENTSIRKPRPAPRKKTESRATPNVDNDQMSEDEVKYENETSVASAGGAESVTDVDGTVESAEAEEPEELLDSADELPVQSPRPQRHRQPPYWLHSGDFVTKAAVTPQLYVAPNVGKVSKSQNNTIQDLETYKNYNIYSILKQHITKIKTIPIQISFIKFSKFHVFLIEIQCEE